MCVCVHVCVCSAHLLTHGNWLASVQLKAKTYPVCMSYTLAPAHHYNVSEPSKHQ